MSDEEDNSDDAAHNEDSDTDEKHGYSTSHLASSSPSSPTDTSHTLHPLQRYFSPTSLTVPSLPSAPPPRSLVSSPDTLTLVRQLYHLALSSLGPHSTPKLIHLNPASPYISLITSSSRLFSPASNLPLTHPISLLLSNSLSSAHADGGLYTLALTCRLIYHASLFPHLPPALISHAHQLALGPLLSSLASSSQPLPLRSLPLLLSLIRSIIHSKPVPVLSSSASAHLSLTILRAFLHCLPTPHLLRYLQYPAAPTTSSLLYPGVVLDSLPPSPLPPSPCCCLLHTASLAFDPADLPPGLQEQGNGTAPVSVMAAMVERWVEGGVQLLLCQKVVHPHLKYLAAVAGVQVVDRLGLRAAQAVEGLIRGSAAGVADEAGEVMGEVRVEGRWMAGKRRLCLTAAGGTVATVVVAGEGEGKVDELMEVVERAMAALRETVTEGGAEARVTAGGGGTEALMAAALRQWVKEREGRMRERGKGIEEGERREWERVVKVERGVREVCGEVVKAIADIGRQIRTGAAGEADGSEEDAVRWEEVDGVRQWRCVGWDSRWRVSWQERGGELQVDDDTLVDSVATKERSIRRAVELAAVVMRVKGVLRS